jgi:hypothetical protein
LRFNASFTRPAKNAGTRDFVAMCARLFQSSLRVLFTVADGLKLSLMPATIALSLVPSDLAVQLTQVLCPMAAYTQDSTTSFIKSRFSVLGIG